jgi:hypothetical protein
MMCDGSIQFLACRTSGRLDAPQHLLPLDLPVEQRPPRVASEIVWTYSGPTEAWSDIPGAVLGGQLHPSDNHHHKDR